MMQIVFEHGELIWFSGLKHVNLEIEYMINFNDPSPFLVK